MPGIDSKPIVLDQFAHVTGDSSDRPRAGLISASLVPADAAFQLEQAADLL